MPDTLPETFGRYRIVQKLGEGGMGAVYLAEDTRMRRKVALKIPNFGSQPPQTVLERFYREARVAAAIQHPGVCRVFDVDCINGVHFLTMEFIDGTPLDRLLSQSQPWPVDRAIELTIRIAEALHALHERGIIHRDLKPANVTLQRDGSPVLLDFGLARSLGAASQQLTAEGLSMGTPAYMAPEQISGKPDAVGPVSDVYALGVILFQLLTGRLPFSPSSMAELYGLLLHAERPRPSNFAAVGGLLDQLCLDVMAINPKQRPPTMSHLIVRLRQCITSTAKLPPLPGSMPRTLPVPELNAQTEPVFGVSTFSTTQRPAIDDDIPEMIGVAKPSNARRFAVIGAVASMLLTTVALTVWYAWKPTPAPGSTSEARKPTQSTTKAIPDETVQLLPIPAQEIAAGTSQMVSVNIERSGPRKSEVKLFQDGVEEGIQLRLNPIVAGATQGQISVSVDSKAKPGDYKVRLVASVDGKIQSEIEWTVRVRPVQANKEFTNSIGMQFRRIPAGKFTMGSPETESGRDRDEGPQHEVEITQDFFLGVYEVTQEEYEKVMGTNPARFRNGGANEAVVQGLETKRFPVESVSWEDAMKFLDALNNRPEESAKERVYRLPTEAEWEYACRGGAPTYRVFHYGDKLTFADANFNWNDPYGSNEKKTSLGRPVPVDDPKYQPNAFGLYHMHGNVYEWCHDWYDSTYYQTCVDKNFRKDPQGPQNPPDPKYPSRVVRGDCWSDGASYCRSANRYAVSPDSRGNCFGFRVLCVKTR